MMTVQVNRNPEVRWGQKRRPRPGRRLRILAFMAIIGLFAALGSIGSVSAADDEFYQTAGGVSVYIGLLPAEIVKGHPAAHPEATMHGGPPSGQHQYHLVVAVFEASGGQRVSDATVKARVSELGFGGGEIVLQPMKIADTITYGGFVDFPSTAHYVIHIEVIRPGAAVVTFDFSYDHQPP